MAHVYGACTVVDRAKKSFGEGVGCALQTGMAAALLAFKPTTSQLATVATVAFNYAVWYTRTHFFCTIATPLAEDQAVARIVGNAMGSMPVDKSKRREMLTRNFACTPPSWERGPATRTARLWGTRGLVGAASSY